jgi:hypothetical protein
MDALLTETEHDRHEQDGDGQSLVGEQQEAWPGPSVPLGMWPHQVCHPEHRQGGHAEADDHAALAKQWRVPQGLVDAAEDQWEDDCQQ